MNLFEAAGVILAIVWVSEIVLVAVTYRLVNRDAKPKTTQRPARSPAPVARPGRTVARHAS